MKKKNKKGKPNTPKRKKPRKKPNKLWGLERLTYTKAAQQYLDQDYIQQLDFKEKSWLSKFNEEYYNNTLSPNWHKNLHYKEQKKAIYDQTNARNRDIFNKRYKFNENESGIAIPESFSAFTNPEDAILDYLDTEEKIKIFVKSALDAQTDREFVQSLTKVVFDVE